MDSLNGPEKEPDPEEFYRSNMWFLSGTKGAWTPHKAQQAYLVGGFITFILLCLVSIFLCACWGLNKMLRNYLEEKKEDKKRQKRKDSLSNSSKRYRSDDSPVLQRGMKYMPQIDVISSEAIGMDVSPSQTYFFDGRK